MKCRFPAGLVTGLAVAAATATPAGADPVTVELRIEGPTRTIFEGPVTTDVRGLRFTGDTVTHRCDATTVGGSSPTPVPTRGAVLAAAAKRAPFLFTGTWHPDFGATFETIDGESVAFDAATGRFLGEYENNAFASLGACADPVEDGDDVLFAYGDGSEVLLALYGPRRARSEQRFTVFAADAATGRPVAGADVGGSLTGADGRVTLEPAGQRPYVDLKAAKTGAIRSNRLRVCITKRPCGGSSDRTAPLARITRPRHGHDYVNAPRELRGRVEADPAGVREVLISLRRKRAGRCWNYSATVERFVRRPCGGRLRFAVDPERRRWSYLLPERLLPGRYALEAVAVDRAGNRDRLERGRNKVVFRVR
jgi:hypothetical protein